MEIKGHHKFLCEETEQYILGTLIRWNDKIVDLDISPDDFAVKLYGEVFSDMLSQYSENQNFDVASIVPKYASRSHDGIDIKDHLTDVLQNCYGFDPKQYADKIKELSRKRKIQDCLIFNLITADSKTADELLQDVADMATDTIKSEVRSHDEVLNNIKSGMTTPKKCYSTGLQPIDIAMGGGLYEGYTYGFCGAEKAGKTTMAHTISYNLNVPHLYVAMEMGSEQIEQRNLARDIGVNSLAFLERPAGLLQKIETANINRKTKYLDAPGMSLDEILMNISKSRIKDGIKGFIIDYWQLIGGQIRGESEEKHLRTAAQGLADYARKSGLWCILLAQMNTEGRLFGGNGLRKACDQLYMIHDCGEYSQTGRWLKQDASRYTIRQDVGSEDNHKIWLETKIGPYFDCYRE